MHSGMYDKDCTTWNTTGGIEQIKFVKKAVDQGKCIVGLRSKKFAVLGGFRMTQQEGFSNYTDKVFKIDDHCGIAISGLTADARVLAEYMRLECLNHRYVFEEPMNVGRLVAQIGDKSQAKTLFSGKRPYGVGLLVQSYEEDTGKAHIYETSPSGDYFEYVAFSTGDRSQAARTYLERHFESFEDLDQKALIQHAVSAMSNAFRQDTVITSQNIDVSVVGEGQKYKKLTPEELAPFIAAAAPVAADGGDDEDGAAPMDTSG